ncbi:OTU domain-containing protein 4 [Xenopus tropicalis]|uniref:OTU domain-containing protein 4 n=1 Tax=Xenopus tropicalis TaxID=8364 RepID=Q0IHU0_XENTR|nr:OTU domain-containing protein 4 [Xenopus tropicalis]AAI22972.1 HIV-1 induced protein HIN-1 [Xenopus tropicalis]|eukprot:NP_001072598.1 OTU domain-containing protein 4 [Xenopus tropicalis]
MDGQGGKGTVAHSKDEAAMDSYLRSEGLYRKKIAKDGSCLFRAVAEQVMHSQSEHLKIRKSCINYLRKNRGQYEALIEGSFEDYLKSLENPQEWVGQVEISALSLMFKKDFIIYQEPNVPPACVTENGFSEKIMLCFSNGNHYDIIYPIGFAESAAMCQSIIYELLYEKVMGVNVGKYMVEQDTCGPNATGEVYCSDGSGSEGEDVSKNIKTNFADMNGFKPHKDDKCPQKKKEEPTMLPSVLRSLHTTQYRNVEYEVWLKTQRDQQKLDFSIAAGMQYSVGDKCQVRVEPGGKFYNAHIQEVGTETGPVIVFVEELGEKHAVQLKHLKPIPQTIISTEGWNTVAGKKQKKALPSGTNAQTEKDYRGQKGFGKPVKQQAAQPLRQQQAAGNKQYGLSSQLSDQAPQSENKGRSKTPPKVPGRKVERERSENVTFGLTVEERKEKEAIEESKSLYEMQSMDKDAFPALSSLPIGERAVQNTEVFPVKRIPNVITENTRRKSEGEDQRDKASTAQATKGRDQKCCDETVKQLTSSDADDLPSMPVLRTSAEHQASPIVPSTPSVVTSWPGIPAQIPSMSATGSDSSVLQPQVTSSPYPPLPVSVPAVNQPLLPLPQTLSALQDPLYPGFPLNEKGERATVPSYSFCKNGGDLPDDKSILRFFFNLGLKAYTYPMWPPHTHLYPLHQAYLNMCRMYPNIPVYPQGSWVQETSENQSEVDPSLLSHPSEVRMESQGSQPLTVSSSPVQVPGIVGQIPNQSESGVINQALHTNVDFEDPATSKTIFPQPPFAQSSYMGAVPIATPYFPHFWYGYPYQGYIESPVIRHNVYIPPQDRDLPENLSSEAVENNSSNQIAIRQSLDLQEQCKPDLPLASSTGGTSSELISNASTVQSEQRMNVNIPQVLTGHKSLPSKMKDNLVPPLASTPIETKETAYGSSEDKERSEVNAVALGSTQANVSEEKALRAREESSEDEREVSNMLSSGRSKNFYSQSYSTRRPRSEKYYQPNRGGYQHPRGEEGWRGQRGRDDGFQHHRSYRGRPYRRRPMGDSYRAQQE